MAKQLVDHQASALSTDERVEDGGYFGSSILTTTAAMSHGYILIRCGASVRTHMALSYKTTEQGYFEAYTAATITDDGTPTPVNNFYVGHSATPALTAFSAPTVSAEGVRILRFLMIGGEGPSSVGASDAIGTKFILPPGFVVLVKMVNSTPQAGEAAININFYEVPV